LAAAEIGDGCAGATVEGEGRVEGVGGIGSPGASEHRERVSFHSCCCRSEDLHVSWQVGAMERGPRWLEKLSFTLQRKGSEFGYVATLTQLHDPKQHHNNKTVVLLLHDSLHLYILKNQQTFHRISGSSSLGVDLQFLN
jgi:hypothetical protein